MRACVRIFVCTFTNTQGEDLAAVLVDHVQPRKTIHDEDAVAQRCYQTSDERWYGEQLLAC